MLSWFLSWLSPDVPQTLAFTLLHTLWQGAVIAAALALTLRLMPASRGTARYAITGVALGGMVFAALVTWSMLRVSGAAVAAMPERPRVAEAPEHRGAFAEGVSWNPSVVASPKEGPVAREMTSGIGPSRETAESPAAVATRPRPASGDDGRAVPAAIHWTTWLALAWLVGAICMLFRVVLAIVATRRLLRDSGGDPSLIARLQNLVDDLCRELGIRLRVRVAACARVRTPAVLGIVWPVLLIPPALLTGIPAEHWRILLTHELAHVWRYDFAINLLQMIVEAVLFFNPFVWWISRQMRMEREACCDAWAARLSGQPLSVATTLLDVAERLCAAGRYGTSRGTMATPTVPPLAAAALLSAAGDGESGSLRDRVYRLARPDSAPALRLRWRSLVLLLFVCAAMLAALHCGANAVVQTAAQLLTPRQRVDRVAELQQETAEEGRQRPGQVTLAGVVRTTDGSALPANVVVLGYSSRPQSSITSALAFESQPGQRMQFSSQQLPAGRVFVTAKADGYAPAVLGPFQAKSGDKLENLELVLSRGFTGRVRLMNKAKTPIGHGDVRAAVSLGTDTSGMTIPLSRVQVDEDGWLQIEHVHDRPIVLKVRAPGYQTAERMFMLQPEQPAEWTLEAARPATGRVVSADNGVPVAKAELVLVSALRRTASGTHTYGGNDPRDPGPDEPPLATTKDDGHFVLDTLEDDLEYTCYVRAAGYGSLLLESVVAGERDRLVKLPPPLVVSGKIVGPLDKLHRRQDGGARIQYRNPLPHYDYLLTADVTVRDGAGYFQLTDLIPGRVSLFVADRTLDLNVQKSVEDLVVDLAAPLQEIRAQAKRRVVLRLTGLQENAPARGQLRAHWLKPGSRPPMYGPGTLVDIKDNQVAFDVEAPTEISYAAERVPGYQLEPKSGIPVTPGDQPVIIDVPVQPAGAIHGRVRNADGAPADGCDVILLPVKSQKGLGIADTASDPQQSAPSFLFAPVRLDHQYQLLVRDFLGGRCVVALSEPIAVDEHHPIREVDLLLPAGQDHSVRVVDPAGQPISGVGVALRFSVSYGDRRYTMTTAAQQTGTDGLACFLRVNVELPGEAEVCVKPSAKVRGQQVKADWRNSPQTVTLQPGVSAHGVLVEAATGRRIPRAELTLTPRDSQSAAYRESINGHTNDRGEFRFDNLEPIEYQIGVSGAVHPNVQIVALPDGRQQFVFPHEHRLFLRAGDPAAARIAVQLLPDSTLKTVAAP